MLSGFDGRDEAADPDADGAQVADVVDLQLGVELSALLQDERISSPVMASTPQPKETSWMSSISSWVQTKRAALYILAW